MMLIFFHFTRFEENAFTVDQKAVTAASTQLNESLRAILVGDFQANGKFQNCKVCPYNQTYPSKGVK